MIPNLAFFAVLARGNPVFKASEKKYVHSTSTTLHKKVSLKTAGKHTSVRISRALACLDCLESED